MQIEHMYGIDIAHVQLISAGYRYEFSDNRYTIYRPIRLSVHHYYMYIHTVHTVTTLIHTYNITYILSIYNIAFITGFHTVIFIMEGKELIMRIGRTLV